MRPFTSITLFCPFILMLAFCGNYDKDNTTAASKQADLEREARKKQHPGLHTVEILDMVFQPASLTINKGDTVVWINKDMLAHDVTEELNKSWMSGRMEAGATWQKGIDQSTNYYCSLHEVMKGKIIVTSGTLVANK